MCDASPARSYHLMLFSVNQQLGIVEIESFREFSGVGWLQLFNCSNFCPLEYLNAQKIRCFMSSIDFLDLAL